jgi:hypothetical protein
MKKFKIKKNIYNQFNECSGLFPLISCWGVDAFIFLQGLWPRHSSFLRLVCLVAWQWMLLFHSVQLFFFWRGGFFCGCLSPGFLSRVGPLEQPGSQKWSCEGGWWMSSCQPLPLTGQDCELEMSFSLVRRSVSACFHFLQGSAMPGFPHSNCWVAPLRHRLFQICVLPLPQVEWKYSFCVFGHQFCQTGCNWLPICARMCGSLPVVALTWWVCRFT